MAKILLVCPRKATGAMVPDEKIRLILDRIAPDNIDPTPPRIERHSGVVVGVYNPTKASHIDATSAYLGVLLSPSDDWPEVGADAPDGSFALFRYDLQTLEVVADPAASWTIWYAQTPDTFIASTSQRAIVSLLGQFQPNTQAFFWVLSTGYLGPGQSWDRRIKSLGRDERLILNRDSWELRTIRKELQFQVESLSDDEHRKALETDLASVLDNLKLNMEDWVLPISGGYDSRLLLILLKDRAGLSCVTWGLKSSLDVPLSDASIANELAQHFNVEHRYFNTDLPSMSKDSVETVLNRFIAAAEGRIDHIDHFTDGLEAHKHFFETKKTGVIRGTETFGWRHVTSAYDVLFYTGVRLARDYPNLAPLLNHLNDLLGNQELPESFGQRANETLATWRDRLFVEFDCPVVFASLACVTHAYVDMIHPYLSRKLIQRTAKLPDRLRTDKRLFKDIVLSWSPQIDFAKYYATGLETVIFHNKQVLEPISDELKTAHAKSLLSQQLIDFVLSNVTVAQTSSPRKKSLKEMIQPLVPLRVRRALRSRVAKAKLDVNLLAYRAYTICKMSKMLSEDARISATCDG